MSLVYKSSSRWCWSPIPHISSEIKGFSCQGRRKIIKEWSILNPTSHQTRSKSFLLSRWFHFQYLLLLRLFCLAICFYYQIIRERFQRKSHLAVPNLYVEGENVPERTYTIHVKTEKFRLSLSPHIIIIYSREHSHVGIQIALHYQ